VTTLELDLDFTIAADGQIELQGRHTDAERRRESRQGIFRHQAARTAVPLQIETMNHAGHSQQPREQGTADKISITISISI